MTVISQARSFVHWGIAHGVPRTVLRMAARRGDIQATLIASSHAASRGVDDPVFAIIEQIRAQGPMNASSFSRLTADHAVVREVLTSNDFRTGIPGRTGTLGRISNATAPRTLHPVEPPSLLVTEPPDHTRYRKLVMKVFTMRKVEQLRSRTQAITDELLDELKGRDSVDLVEAYCARLPVTVIAQILGVPDSQQQRVLEFGAAAAPSLDLGLPWRQYRTVDRALADFDAWLGEHLDYLRRNPGDNLLSDLVAVRDEDGGLNEAELRSTAGLVLAAGFETTVNLLSNGIALLHDNPDQLEVLRADPSLWANTVEEVLRLDPPVLLTGRACVRETEVAGQRVREGDLVTTLLAGANRDPAVFTDPARFDVARPNAREHLSFSAGRHHCLGAMLARMEGEVGLRSIFERYPDLTLLPGAHRRSTRILRGFEVLPARIG